jgi:hypothetical protein
MKYEEAQIIAVIEKINCNFKEALLSLYSYAYQGNTDVYSYYLTGHCPSYAQILYNIFMDADKIEFYSLRNERNGIHIATKINEHFYDVCGNIDRKVSQEDSQRFDYNYMGFIQEYYGNNDTIDCLLIHQLSEIGTKQKIKTFSKSS